MKYSIRAWVALAISTMLAAPLSARTITLTDEDSDRMAQICEQAPRSSWAGIEWAGGVFSNTTTDLTPSRAFLIRFPLDEIPKDQRITKAELTIPVGYAPGEPKIMVRRIVASWGAGVSWTYRQTGAKKVEWTSPGAKGGGKDRVNKPTATAKAVVGEVNVNLTEDVELWYSGLANNEGWIFTVDSSDGMARLNSPAWYSAGTWKLRITFEPK
jgi:hypothetical protein